ncbi:hypothetical protein ACIF8W_32630 [Streptomyces sp. NPDC085639]|uniref:hypothetical protein n=1 Tax=Streptomyces sp. NPDC085639 TaxID=3365734 RepID=UPI0037D4EBE2
MGFSGHLVFARSQRPLLEAPPFGSTAQGLRDDVSLWLATPEFGEAIGRKCAELDAEVPADAGGALLWASAAGVQPAAQQSRIEELLRARETFVEELVDALLEELGFPEAVHSAPQP